MKKLALLIIAIIFVSTLAAYADVEFDPSQYSEEELSAIQEKISNYLSSLSKTEEDEDENVLYNENGIYIEYRGIVHYSKDSWIFNIYVENSSGKELFMTTKKLRINRFAMGFSNNGAKISDGTIYLSSPNFRFILDTDDLKEYGISAIEKIEFNLGIYEESEFSGEAIAELPITIETYEPVK